MVFVQILLLARKENGTVLLLNWEYKLAFVVLVFFFFAGKRSRTLHFLCIFARTGPISNWGYKMTFASWKEEWSTTFSVHIGSN